MQPFPELFGPWALVTGASSGIGKAFAHRLAAMRMNLVLVARREERLRQLADALHRRHAVTVRVVAADLFAGHFLPRIERATQDVSVGLLVNNAGVATAGNFLDNELDTELALLHINTRAPLMLAHHFGRSMRQRGRGSRIFVLSTIAFSAVPAWSNYAASKVYDLGLAEGNCPGTQHGRQPGTGTVSRPNSHGPVAPWRHVMVPDATERRRGRCPERVGQKDHHCFLGATRRSSRRARREPVRAASALASARPGLCLKVEAEYPTHRGVSRGKMDDYLVSSVVGNTLAYVNCAVPR
jgi:short subunit dehydrogenase